LRDAAKVEFAVDKSSERAAVIRRSESGKLKNLHY
jgi:hypothetical protein